MDQTKEDIEMAGSAGTKDYGEGMRFTFLMFRHKLFIIAMVTIATAASVIISLNLPVEYKSTVNAVRTKTTSSLLSGAMGGISSALKDFGLTKFGEKSGESYNFMVVLESRAIIDSLIIEFNLPEKYDIPDTLMYKIRKVLAENVEIAVEKAGNYIISVWDENPQTAADMANRIVELANERSLQLFHTEAAMSRVEIEKRLNNTDSTLNAIAWRLSEYSKEKNIFSPMDQAKAVSSALADLKAKLMESEVYYELFKNNFGENDPYTQMQKSMKGEIQKQLDDAMHKPGFAGNFTVSNAAGVGVEYVKLYAEFEATTKIKAVLAPMLEKAKLDEKRSAKSLIIIDDAIPAKKKDRPKRSVFVIGAFFGSFVLSTLIILLINSASNFKRKYNSYRENSAT